MDEMNNDQVMGDTEETTTDAPMTEGETTETEAAPEVSPETGDMPE